MKVHSLIWHPLQESAHLKFLIVRTYVCNMQLYLSSNAPHKSSIRMYLTHNYAHTIFSYSFLILSTSQELVIRSFTRVPVHVGCKWVPKEVCSYIHNRKRISACTCSWNFEHVHFGLFCSFLCTVCIVHSYMHMLYISIYLYYYVCNYTSILGIIIQTT